LWTAVLSSASARIAAAIDLPDDRAGRPLYGGAAAESVLVVDGADTGWPAARCDRRARFGRPRAGVRARNRQRGGRPGDRRGSRVHRDGLRRPLRALQRRGRTTSIDRLPAEPAREPHRSGDAATLNDDVAWFLPRSRFRMDGGDQLAESGRS